VVELVMQNEKKITLAIGDGANDVSMIQSKIEKKKTFFFYYFLN
jgi:hydroxymethylpyrimidine pyrophosphatase-like HAD family hydrolase